LCETLSFKLCMYEMACSISVLACIALRICAALS